MTGLCAACSAQAATIQVTAGDTDNVANGNCSLPEAILSAETDTPHDACTAGSGDDLLELPFRSVFTFLNAEFGPQSNPWALPAIATGITINGNGATIARSGVAGVPKFRLIRVDPSGDLTLDSVTLRGGDPGPGSIGGAIFNTGTITVSNSTLRGNTATNGGSAIVSFGAATLHNCTVSGNLVGSAGAVWNNGGTMEILECTIADNGSSTGGNAVAGLNVSGTVTIRNSLIAKHAGSLRNCGVGEDDRVITPGLSFSDDESCGPLQFDPDVGTLLGPLQDNGGLTFTHLPTPDNPVVDAFPAALILGQGVCFVAFGTAQRGIRRPQEGDGVGAADCDAGAVELVANDVDSDTDGMTDVYEINNDLAPNSDDAGGDFDGDGLANLDEYDAGSEANNPDSDGDGLGDGLDAFVTQSSNACVADGLGDAEFETTAMSGMKTQCAAEASVVVRPSAVVEVDAELELISPNVIFEPGLAIPVTAELRVNATDPTPP